MKAICTNQAASPESGRRATSSAGCRSLLQYSLWQWRPNKAEQRNAVLSTRLSCLDAH